MADINFPNIPQTLRTPLFYADIDNSQANTAQQIQRTLLIGQVTAAAITAGTVPNVPLLSQGGQDAISVGGKGSMLAMMTAAYLAGDPATEIWYLPLADAPGAVAATGTITFSGAPTASGTVAIYIAGKPVLLPVSSAQTAAQIATAFAAAVNVALDMPVTATAAGAVVTLTAINLGSLGNDIDIRANYAGAVGGQANPPGLVYAFVAMANGAGIPSLTLGLGNLGSKTFDFIVCPYTDAVDLPALQTALNDTTGRWSYSQQLYGGIFAAMRGTYGALSTYGVTQNNQHTSIVGFYDSPSPVWEWAADYAATCAPSLREDPGVPLHTLQFNTVLAPPIQSRFQLLQQNALLYAGISTFNVLDDGTVTIQLAITTYQVNRFNQPDNSYLKVETMYQIADLLRFLRAGVENTFGRCKLAANGSDLPAGGSLVTPTTITNYLIAQYVTRVKAGRNQNLEGFIANVAVQQNSQNPNRVDVLYPGTLMDQLDIFALLLQFRLQ